MSNNDTASFDEFSVSGQDWFYDELQNGNNGDFDYSASSLNVPLDSGSSPPPPVASTIVHNVQTVQQPSNVYHSNVVQMEEVVPSTSDYGMQQQQQPTQLQNASQQQQQQHSMSQQVQQPQHHHSMQHSQQPQQFETLRTFNHVPQNVSQPSINHQNISQQSMSQPMHSQYQDNQHQQIDMVFDNSVASFNDFDYTLNEATTSSAMPMECGLSQEFNHQGQQQQYQIQNIGQQRQQQIPQNDWSQPPPQSQAMTVVYTSSTQSIPKISDPGGHSSQQTISYNTLQQPQQIIHTGLNGDVINMQPMHIQNQQQYEVNSGSYVQYIDNPIGSQQYITQDQLNSSYQQVQIINQPMGIQQMQQVEPVKQVAKAKPRTTKATPKKKSQQSFTTRLEAVMAGIPKMELNLESEQSTRFITLLNDCQKFFDMDPQDPAVLAEFKIYEDEILQIMNRGTKVDSQPKAGPSHAQPQYVPPPQESVMYSTNSKRKKTKADYQQQKKAAAIAAQPLPLQTPIAVNDSRIVAQDSNSITVNYEGKMMRAIMVANANGTATYQILGGVDEISSMTTPSMNATVRHQHTREHLSVIDQVSARAGPDEKRQMSNIVSSVIDSCDIKPKIGRKPASSRARNYRKPATADVKVFENRNVVIESKPLVNQMPRMGEPLCLPSTSYPAKKIVVPVIAHVSRIVRDKKEFRKKKISEFLNKMSENMDSVDMHGPFTEKQDVLQRLLPYGFYYEPNLSERSVDIFDNELERHRVRNDLQHYSLKKRMDNIFLKELEPKNDHELNMLLALDLNYEKRLLEADKLKAEANAEQFVLESDVVPDKEITKPDVDFKRKQLKPKLRPHVKGGLNYDIGRFDEQIYRQRRQNIIDEAERLENEKREKERVLALPPPSVDSIPSPLTIASPFVPNMDAPPKLLAMPKAKPQKTAECIHISTDSESSASSDDSYHESKTNKQKPKKSSDLRAPSPQKKIVAAPKKAESNSRSLSPSKSAKEKAKVPLSSTAPKPISKHVLPPPLPPGYASIKFDSGYKIPRIPSSPRAGSLAKLPAPPPPPKLGFYVATETSKFKKPDMKSPERSLKKELSKEADKKQSGFAGPVRVEPIRFKNVFEHPYAHVQVDKDKEHKKSKEERHREKERHDSRDKFASKPEKLVGKPSKEPAASEPGKIKLKISVGGSDKKKEGVAPAMSEEERKKEKKRKKKERKEKERKENEEKERLERELKEREEKERRDREEKDRKEREDNRRKEEEEKEAKRLRKLAKEKKRAEKEAKRQKKQVAAAESQSQSSSRNDISNPATPDVKQDPSKLVLRIKKLTAPESSPSVFASPQPGPVVSPPPIVQRITVKIPKLEEKKEHRHKDREHGEKKEKHRHKDREHGEHRQHKKEKKEKRKRDREESSREQSSAPLNKFPKLTIKLGQKATPVASNNASPAAVYQPSPHSEPVAQFSQMTSINSDLFHHQMSNDAEREDSIYDPPMSMFDAPPSMERSQSPLSMRQGQGKTDIKSMTNKILLKILER